MIKDSEGTVLKVGDVVEYKHSYKDRGLLTGTVVGMRTVKAYDAKTGLTPVDVDEVQVRKSAKTIYPDYVYASTVRKVGEGALITKAEIAAAKKQREQNASARKSAPKVMKKPTKSHFICYVMLCEGAPMLRIDIMRRVHVLEGSELVFKPTSNGCYFLTEGCSTMYNKEAAASLIRRGLIVQSGKVGRRITYSLTPAGKAHAEEYIAWKQ